MTIHIIDGLRVTAQFYFADSDECKQHIEALRAQSEALEGARLAASQRWKEHFTWGNVLGQYEALLESKIR